VGVSPLWTSYKYNVDIMSELTYPYDEKNATGDNMGVLETAETLQGGNEI